MIPALFSPISHAVAGALPAQVVETGAWYANWYPDPLGLLAILAGYLYWRGLRDWKHRSRPHSGWQSASFYAGIIALVIAYMSPVDAMADRLFWMHQVQHVLIRMVGPAFIMIGSPITPILRGLPAGTRLGVVAPLVSNRQVRSTYFFLTNPVVASVLFIGSLIVWQIPAPHDLSVRNDWVHYFMHFTMFVSAAILWWVVIDPKPRRSRAHYATRVLILGVLVIPNSLLAASIVLTDQVLYESYGLGLRAWSTWAITDQRWGGIIMWLPVDMMQLLACIVVFSMWYQRELRPGGRPTRRATGAASRQR